MASIEQLVDVRHEDTDMNQSLINAAKCLISPELLHHQQTAGLSVRGAEPPGSVLQEASPDAPAEAESAEFAHHHHQDLLPGKNL